MGLVCGRASGMGMASARLGEDDRSLGEQWDLKRLMAISAEKKKGGGSASAAAISSLFSMHPKRNLIYQAHRLGGEDCG